MAFLRAGVVGVAVLVAPMDDVGEALALPCEVGEASRGGLSQMVGCYVVMMSLYV